MRLRAAGSGPTKSVCAGVWLASLSSTRVKQRTIPPAHTNPTPQQLVKNRAHLVQLTRMTVHL